MKSILLMVVGFAVPALAGPLSPPVGPVASTYKTLTEVEPRIAINATNTPGDGLGSYRITQSGSYYLTGNLTGASSRSGILIAASDVTIDLNGFTLRGVTGAFNGITTDGARSNITIRNGTIANWPFSAAVLNSGNGGVGCQIEDVHSILNGGQNIVVGQSSIVRNCVVYAAGSYGIFAPAGNVVIESCTVNGAVSYGIVATSSATVRSCNVSGVSGPGILVSAGGVVENCAVNACNIGFYVEAGSTAIGCVARNCTSDGFFVNLASLALNNMAQGNGTIAVDGAGIHVFGADNRIEGNNLTANDFGIRAEGAGNLIVRNSASGNTAGNWNIVGGNFGLFVNATAGASSFSGSAGGAGLGSTDPWANFSY